MNRIVHSMAPAFLAFTLVVGGALSLAPAVAAKGSAVIRTGSCSGSSVWKLKLSPDNGRIEVEFEVDQNVIGQTWKVKLKHNGVVFWRGHRTTQAPSGSFTVRKFVRNRAGTDKIVGRAANPQTGEVCRGVASL